MKMKAARNWTERIFEPGTTFLIRDQGPGYQVSNSRRAAAYAGDIGGSMIVAPLLASTAMQIGGGLYNTAAPEALDIPAESLANLAALGAMGYGIHKGIARFHNAGGWPGLMGKFADQATIVTPGPKPGPDVGPMPVNGPGPQEPVPGGTPPIYPRPIIIEDGDPSVPPVSVMLDPPPRPDAPPPFMGVAVAPSSVGKTVRDAEPVVVDVPVQQVMTLTPQELAALAMEKEANRRRQAQMVSNSPLSQIPAYPQSVSIPSSVAPLTLNDLRNNPYSSDYLTF